MITHSTAQLRGLAAALLIGTAAFTAPAPATAAILDIVDAPKESSGPFWHNVFHTANSNNAMSGQIKAWFGLDTDSSGNTYDTVTGAFDADFLIFKNKNSSQVVGTASASGSIDSALLNAAPGSIAGTLTWSFNLTDSNHGLYKYLDDFGDPNTLSITQTFLSDDFVTASSGRIANSFQTEPSSSYITLWGADGFSNGAYQTPTLGVDLVVELQGGLNGSGNDDETEVPEPAGLAALGLIIALLQRRFR